MMAKRTARGCHVVQQVKGTKPDSHTADGLVHITLTHRSDGRILRKLGWKHGSKDTSTWWNYSSEPIIATVREGMTDEQALAAMQSQARRWGYEVST
jgi:hypothetical protein